MSVESPRNSPTLRMPVVVCVLLSLLIGVLRLGRSLEPKSVFGWWMGHPDNLGNHWLLVWVAERLQWESPLSTISTMFQLEIVHGWLEMEAKVFVGSFSLDP